MNASRFNQLLAALFLATMTQQASAYTTIKCGGSSTKWSGNNYTVRASSVGFPVGPWRDALSSVVSHWNGNPSNLSFGVVWDEPAVAANNNENEAWWEANNGPNIGTSPAITYVWFKGDCTLKEADVIFNNSVAFHYTTSKTSLWPYGGANRPFQTTAMHEFGHAAGLAHTANTYNIMGAVYGLWTGGPEDLGVVHWKHTGSSGEYSTHGRTRILDTSNVELAKVAGTAEPVYRVNKGQTIKLELTYENLGKTSPLAAKVGYYLSSNDIISVADRFLGEGNVTLYRGFPDTTFNTSLVIPTDLVSGQTYWVGAIIDYNNAYSERSEANNATYIGIRVN
ncbi:MAG: hypothetical protein EBU46_06195 [Nitrosomonadaceae bacterium]|nr:hypothetical protein [Nitrosomonadaceae bacterium]